MPIHWSQLAANIRKMTSDPVWLDVPLWRHVTFRIGGSAALFVQPTGAEGLSIALRAAQKREVPVYLLGGGSNLLVGDAGLQGMVLRTARLDRVTRRGKDRGEDVVAVQSGVSLGALLDHCVGWGLAGLEALAGIPGTVGGAVAMNAGAGDQCIGDAVRTVTCCRSDGSVRTFRVDECGFAYRHSIFQEAAGDLVIQEVTLGLGRARSDRLRREVTERRQRRQRRHPTGYPCAGSVFRNPAGHYAGSLIERAGWKGCRVGGALVAPTHANFIVNAGGATARDVATLIRRIRRSVREQFGVGLELELKTWGVSELC